MGSAASSASFTDEASLFEEAKNFLKDEPEKFEILYRCLTKAKADSFAKSGIGSELRYAESTAAKPGSFNLSDGVISVSNEIAEEINLMRRDPPAYAEFLVERLGSFVEGTKAYTIDGNLEVRYMTQEGPSAVQEAIDVLHATPKLPGVTPNELLEKAARDHSEDMHRTTGLRGHTGSDGSQTRDRIDRYGKFQVTCGENIDYGMRCPRDIIVHLLIDDGVPDRGHRRNLLEPGYICVGAAFGPHSDYRCCCVMDFAGGMLGFEELVLEDTTEACTGSLSDLAIKIIRTFGGETAAKIIEGCMNKLSEGYEVKLSYKHEGKSCDIESSRNGATEIATYKWS